MENNQFSNCFKLVYYVSFTPFFIYLIHGPDLQSQLVHHSDEELKVKEGEKVTNNKTMLENLVSNFH